MSYERERSFQNGTNSDNRCVPSRCNVLLLSYTVMYRRSEKFPLNFFPEQGSPIDITMQTISQQTIDATLQRSKLFNAWSFVSARLLFARFRLDKHLNMYWKFFLNTISSGAIARNFSSSLIDFQKKRVTHADYRSRLMEKGDIEGCKREREREESRKKGSKNRTLMRNSISRRLLLMSA